MFMRPGRGLTGSESQVLRPMITGLPMVVFLKKARSPGSRQGRPPSRPITPFRARATGPTVRMGMATALDRHRGLDVRMGLVALKPEIVVLEGEEVGLWDDRHGREGIRRTGQLLL